jgi:DNA-binding MarR family transcriptional regulator
MPGRERAGREDSLADDFWAATRRLRQRSRETLAPWDISPSHARALAVLRMDGPMRLGDLSERLHIAPRSATEVVDVLEGHGYLARQPDARDRRATLVGLTEEGQRATADIQAARTAEADRFFGALSAADRTRLRRILRILAQ